jgi:hypothetical protein
VGREAKFSNGSSSGDALARISIAPSAGMARCGAINTQARTRIRTLAVLTGFFAGDLGAFLGASERPMAMACLRLVTRPPLPPLPERSVPRFLLRMALATVLPAPLPYLRREPGFLAAMLSSF